MVDVGGFKNHAFERKLTQHTFSRSTYLKTINLIYAVNIMKINERKRVREREKYYICLLLKS